MSRHACFYCVRPLGRCGQFACRWCDIYMDSLLTSRHESDRERGAYLMGVAVRHATNRFLGRSDL